MTGRYLLLGMIAGLIAGVLAFGASRYWGEPPVAAAIAIEEAASAAESHADEHSTGDHDASDHSHADTEQAAEPAGHSHGDEALVSRETQAGFGLLTGMLIFGAGLGGVFGLAFALIEGRFSQLSAQGTAAAMAVLGYISVVFVPQMKYPANPPAVGHGETIGLRTQFFFTMMLLSVVAMLIAVAVARSGKNRWQSGMLAGGLYLLLIGATSYVLPSFNEVPEGFPGDLLWQFRTVSLAIEGLLWATIGLVFGWLVQRDWSHRLRLNHA